MNKRTACIDPGLNECGFAVFEAGALVDARLLVNPVDKDAPHNERLQGMATQLAHAVADSRVGAIVVERMEPRSSKTSAWSSLIDLSLISGALLGGPNAVIFLRPSMWTGGRSKAQNHPRIRRRLNLFEAAVLENGLAATPEANHKELLDAVGIGLYHFMRL